MSLELHRRPRVLAAASPQWAQPRKAAARCACACAAGAALPCFHSTTDCTTSVLNVVAYHNRCFTDCIMYTPTSSSFGSTQK